MVKNMTLETRNETTPKATQQVSPDILNHPDRRLRLPEVKALTGYSTASIYAKMAEKTFPKNQTMGGRAVAWRLGDILDFLNNFLDTESKKETA